MDDILTPLVRDKGYNWEVSNDETPLDLWSLQGEIPPSFESTAEKRWVKENKASPYTLPEKLPLKLVLVLSPGVTGC